MPIYETVFITRQDLGTAQVEQLTKDYSKVLTDMGGKNPENRTMGSTYFCVHHQQIEKRSLHLDRVRLSCSCSHRDGTFDAQQRRRRSLHVH